MDPAATPPAGLWLDEIIDPRRTPRRGRPRRAFAAGGAPADLPPFSGRRPPDLNPLARRPYLKIGKGNEPRSEDRVSSRSAQWKCNDGGGCCTQPGCGGSPGTDDREILTH